MCKPSVIAMKRLPDRVLGKVAFPCYNTRVVSPHRLAAQDNTLSRCRSRVRIPLGVPRRIQAIHICGWPVLLYAAPALPEECQLMHRQGLRTVGSHTGYDGERMGLYSLNASTVRIGAGAGFAGDRLDPAVDLAERGRLDALVFEILAERTIALAQRRRRSGSGPGYDERLVERVGAVLPAALAHGTIIITNGGAAEPRGGGMAIREAAEAAGFARCRVAVVSGDDVLGQLDLAASTVLETGEPLANYRDRLLSANAYLGVAPLLAALRSRPDVIVAGRTTDAALFLAPLAHAFGWAADDWNTLARGSVVGHLLECAGQLTGGYFADGARKQVPGLARLGFPFADVATDGTALLGKLPGTGGRLDRATCLEQLLYEVEDPARYLTPDVIVDFRQVRLEETGPAQVRVSGAQGRPAPDTLKVSVGIDGGFVGVGAISYAGRGCVARAQLAAAIVRERWAGVYGRDAAALQTSLIGLTSCTPWQGVEAPHAAEPPEVRLRIAVQAFERKVAVDLAREVEALYTNGPAGGGGVETTLRDTVAVISTLMPKAQVTPQIEVLE